jgi:ubiquinone/menaquinone biosynthesis C-methylase UbiE
MTVTALEVAAKFDRVASTYDLLTGLNPGYSAHVAESARRMALGPGARILDLCCGTGTSTAAVRAAYPDAEIVGLDISAGMLDRARRKPGLNATFVHGDGMDPAASVDGPFDGVLMAYGIRNMPDKDAALANLLPLLKPGGVVAFHEYSVADSAWSTALWNLVCWTIIIPGGALTAPGSDIYTYLRRSVVEFDGASAFEDRLRRHGYVDVRTEAMGGWQRGILHTFLARRPRSGGV